MWSDNAGALPSNIIAAVLDDNTKKSGFLQKQLQGQVAHAKVHAATVLLQSLLRWSSALQEQQARVDVCMAGLRQDVIALTLQVCMTLSKSIECVKHPQAQALSCQ